MTALSLKTTLLAALLGAALAAQAQTTPGYEFKAHKLGLRVTDTSTPPNPTGPTDPPSTGEPGAPASLTLSTTLVNFGSVATNTTQTRQVVVTNNGGSTLSFSAAPAVTGAAEFAAGLTTCASTLSAGSSCLGEVQFSPTTTGSFDGVLRFTSSLANSPHEVTLLGTTFNPVSLMTATLPNARRSVAYAGFDFKTLLTVSNEASPQKTDARWTLVSGSLPSGMTLNTITGLLSGTPSVVGSASFTVKSVYKNNEGQRVYTLQVGDAVLEAVQVSSTGEHTCAVTPAGAVKCWGYNNVGQLGNGTTTSSSVPVAVIDLSSGVSSVSAGSSHTCVVKAGEVWCWGTGGRLGNGLTTGSKVPVQVLDGSATGPVLTGVSKISAGLSHTCAALSNGSARCWGTNADGQLGDNSTTNRTFAVQVSGLTSGVTDIATGGTTSFGGSFSCAVQSGAAKCWGNQSNGQLGNGVTTDTAKTSAVSVSGLTSGVSAITAGATHACAIQSGAAKCWGSQATGKIGNGVTTGNALTPSLATGMGSGVTALSAGNLHTCAVKTGALYCWGSQNNGRLGNGVTSGNVSTPQAVPSLTSGVASVTSSLHHTCAVLSTGDLKCWGMGSSGQLGNGGTADVATPVNVSP